MGAQRPGGGFLHPLSEINVSKHNSVSTTARDGYALKTCIPGRVL
jgi:hypothetical protein